MMKEKKSNPKKSKLPRPTKLLDYVIKNPFLSIYNLGLIYGGAIAYIFFGMIGYLPEFEFKDAATLLIGIALFGVFFTVVLATYFITPGWMLRELIWKQFYKSTSIDNDSDNNASEGLDKKRRSPFVLSSVIHSILAFVTLASIIIFVGYEDDYIKEVAIFIGLGTLAIGALVQWLRYEFVRYTSGKNHAIAEVVAVFGQQYSLSNISLYFSWLLNSVLLLVILAFPLIDAIKNNDFAGGIALIVLLLFVAVANSFLASLSDRRYFILPVIGLFILFAFTNIPGNKFSIINSVFRSLSIGHIENATFVVNSETCKSVNTLRSNACTPTKEGDLGCIRPDVVANRIGTEFLLVFIDTSIKSGKIKETKIPLKKEAVLTWSFGNGAEPPKACMPLTDVEKKLSMEGQK